MPDEIGSPRFKPISQHGVIGDMRTLALVADDGTIDFFCHPEIDSPSLFAGLLDPDKGGRFRFGASDASMRRRQIYLPDTNILITRFLGEDGIGEVTDFMPVDGSGRIVRQARSIMGEMSFDIDISPRPDYGRQTVSLSAIEGGVSASWNEGDSTVHVYADADLAIEEGRASARIVLAEGRTCRLILCPGRKNAPAIDDDYVSDAFRATRDFWHGWVDAGTFPAYWRELVVRSALTLKLLTSARYGSIAAAATFGLPEVRGGERNWDYRFCWVRDAAFTLYGLSRLGYHDEAEAFIHFLMERAVGEADDAGLGVMYAMDGATEMPEVVLDHFEGFEGARPVRIGNAAYAQRQMDVYGEFLDALYISTKARGKPSFSVWRRVARILDWLCANWLLPDQGIWESRGAPKAYLSSRLMSWVALDRGLKIADRFSLPCDASRWRAERDAIQGSILTEFWNEEIGAFVQSKGSDCLDAVVLLMPLVQFINTRDPFWTSTLKAVRAHLVHDCLVRRYKNTRADGDGLAGEEGAFTTCSFWYVEALARSGEVAEARVLFEKLHTYSNHLGLYSEELSSSGELLGNFPQGLTHLSLISAAFWLDQALKGDKRAPGRSRIHMLEDPDGLF